MRHAHLLLLLSPIATPSLAASTTPPALMLANDYHAQIDIASYWVSEKYDGIRALWTGTALITRSGHPIHAPDWFVAGWPAEPLDGELWIARGRFERLASTVRDRKPDEDAWREVKFMAFDLPAEAAQFSSRLATLDQLLAGTESHTLQKVHHWRVSSEPALLSQLNELIAAGGEGLMLHRADSYYHGERSDDLLKLKAHLDAEAEVIGYVPGQGKYAGMMGALRVRRPDGLEFNLGTGFSDAERRHPPGIGKRVTYSFSGVTARGVPRFARFVRVHAEQ